MNFPASTEHDSTAPARPSRRTVISLALGAAISGVVLTDALAAKPKPKPKRRRGSTTPGADARRRRRRQPKPHYKVVTRTFISASAITIPEEGAATPYPSLLQVGGLRAGAIQDVTVMVSGLSHSYPADVEIVLVAPNGRTAAVLMSDAGGSYEITNVTLVFDDQASGFLPFEGQIVSGSFKPTLPGVAPRPETSTLGVFNGLNPNGTWRLYVADGSSGDVGSMAGWALTIKARVRR